MMQPIEQNLLKNSIFILLGMSLGYVVLLISGMPQRPILFAFLILSLPLGFIWIQDKKKFFLTFIVLDMVLLIDTHMFHDPDLMARTSGLQISLTTLSVLALCILWLFDIFVKKSKFDIYLPKHSIFIFGYLLSYCLSLVNSKDIITSFFEIAILLQNILIYICIINYAKEKSDIIYIIKILLLGLAIEIAFISIQYATGTQFDVLGSSEEVSASGDVQTGDEIDLHRPSGTAKSPNQAAVYLSMMLLVVASLLLQHGNRAKKMVLGGLFSTGTIALILTFSRGGWIAFAMGLTSLFLVSLQRRWIRTKHVVLTAIILALAVGVFAGPIVARLSQDDGGAAYARIPLMKIALRMIHEHPIFGVGINNFGIVLPHYITSDVRGEWLALTHNKYLLTFAETGVVGLTFFLLLLAQLFFLCIRCIQSRDTFLAYLAAGLFAALVTFSLHMMVDKLTQRITIQCFWIIVSIVVASDRVIRLSAQRAERSEAIP
ncbi:MAG: O-antigen ligase family protein [Candidatus Tectomicrobia bacterium]|nr:O-antigen ligase family protein [Candidatus Tectomicrobia bacterium]